MEPTQHTLKVLSYLMPRNPPSTTKCPTSLQVSQVATNLKVLYEYTNKEQEIVASCFRGGNYHHLRDLPNDLAPNSVLLAMKDRMDFNLTQSSKT